MENLETIILNEIQTSADLSVLNEIDIALGRIMKLEEIIFLLKSDIYNENY